MGVNGTAQQLRGRFRCVPAVFIDGQPIRGGADELDLWVHPAAVLAVEVYPSMNGLPGQYITGMAHPCAVVAGVDEALIPPLRQQLPARAASTGAAHRSGRTLPDAQAPAAVAGWSNRCRCAVAGARERAVTAAPAFASARDPLGLGGHDRCRRHGVRAWGRRAAAAERPSGARRRSAPARSMAAHAASRGDVRGTTPGHGRAAGSGARHGVSRAALVHG
jgi:hypothetical protein